MTAHTRPPGPFQCDRLYVNEKYQIEAVNRTQPIAHLEPDNADR
jgi:hypothetical protein